MDTFLFFAVLALALFTFYRLLSRRTATPEMRVKGLLRRHHALQRLGLPERDCLYRQLTKRSGWRSLPPAFLAELVTRLESKENVFRFVSVAEDHRFHTQQLPAIAAGRDQPAAMREVALWLAGFGRKLQSEERYKEAEFVQKLALQLLPETGFTLLPLAATYFKMDRLSEAAPLFRQGLDRLSETDDNALLDSKAAYTEMYAACIKPQTAERNSTPQ